MKPFWVTFYSYKGGVGRSLALANTAARLASKGRRVLLIDFDLEAPGLDSFSEFAAASGKPGVVEYVSEFVRKQAAPDIRQFVHLCDLPGPQRGELWVMPAGRKDVAYNHQLSHINWSELYDSGLGAPFFANWKTAINAEYMPDVVFVDSRTGLTEIGGVCTTQFPDLVVMLFSLNEQNLRGTATVAQSIREADPEQIPQIHFVASPIPNLPPEQRIAPNDRHSLQRRSQLTERLDVAAAHLGVKISSRIRYYAPAALCEKLFVLEDVSVPQPIVMDYDHLCGEIIQFNRTGLDFLIEQANEAIEGGDISRIERISAVLDRDYPKRAEAIFLGSRFALARNDSEAAITLARGAFEIDPLYAEPVAFLTHQYTRLAQFAEIDEVFLRLLAFEHRLSPDRVARIKYDRGRVLMAMGNYAEAEGCFRACIANDERVGMPARLRLVSRFNLAEAKRRASKAIDRAEWAKVLEIFGEAGGTSDSPLPLQANQQQAMHIAYAVSGNLDSAKDALKKARRAAEAVGEIEDVFLVKTYREVSVSEFLAANDEMMAALDRGELWDGMKLPEQTG